MNEMQEVRERERERGMSAEKESESPSRYNIMIVCLLGLHSRSKYRGSHKIG